MPPWQQWYAGREAIRSFFALAWKTCSGLRLVPTAAYGQPAFAVYARTGADAPWAAHSIHVLALEDDMISTLTLFVPPHRPAPVSHLWASTQPPGRRERRIAVDAAPLLTKRILGLPTLARPGSAVTFDSSIARSQKAP
jgi:hypothetical protein